MQLNFLLVIHRVHLLALARSVSTQTHPRAGIPPRSLHLESPLALVPNISAHLDRHPFLADLAGAATENEKHGVPEHLTLHSPLILPPSAGRQLSRLAPHRRHSHPTQAYIWATQHRGVPHGPHHQALPNTGAYPTDCTSTPRRGGPAAKQTLGPTAVFAHSHTGPTSPRRTLQEAPHPPPLFTFVLFSRSRRIYPRRPTAPTPPHPKPDADPQRKEAYAHSP